jgi:hypothetical protein
MSLPDYPGGSDLAIGKVAQEPRRRSFAARAGWWGGMGLLNGIALAWLAVEFGLSADYAKALDSRDSFRWIEVRFLGVRIGDQAVALLTPDVAQSAGSQAVRVWRPRMWLAVGLPSAALGCLFGLVGVLLRAVQRQNAAGAGASLFPPRLENLRAPL